MAKDDVIEVDGVVDEVLPSGFFNVIFGNGHKVRCNISGRLRMNHIKVIRGDKVTVEMSPYDLTKGRISWRAK